MFPPDYVFGTIGAGVVIVLWAWLALMACGAAVWLYWVCWPQWHFGRPNAHCEFHAYDRKQVLTQNDGTLGRAGPHGRMVNPPLIVKWWLGISSPRKAKWYFGLIRWDRPQD